MSFLIESVIEGIIDFFTDDEEALFPEDEYNEEF
jgi:hypothetical protein